MITVTFRCGHSVTVGSQGGEPVCSTCGEKGVSRVKAPHPRISGVAHGPLVTYRDLEPSSASILAEGQVPLKLKPQKKDQADG